MGTIISWGLRVVGWEVSIFFKESFFFISSVELDFCLADCGNISVDTGNGSDDNSDDGNDDDIDDDTTGNDDDDDVDDNVDDDKLNGDKLHDDWASKAFTVLQWAPSSTKQPLLLTYIVQELNATGGNDNDNDNEDKIDVDPHIFLFSLAFICRSEISSL